MRFGAAQVLKSFLHQIPEHEPDLVTAKLPISSPKATGLLAPLPGFAGTPPNVGRFAPSWGETCFEVWVCRGGRWVLDTRRLTITCIGPEQQGGRRRWEGLTWAQAQDRIGQMDSVFRASLEGALRRMSEFEKACVGG